MFRFKNGTEKKVSGPKKKFRSLQLKKKVKNRKKFLQKNLETKKVKKKFLKMLKKAAVGLFSSSSSSTYSLPSFHLYETFSEAWHV